MHNQFNDNIEKYSQLAIKSGGTNLCSGAWLNGMPSCLNTALKNTSLVDAASYPPANGTIELKEAIAEHYAVVDLQRSIEANQITITSGATGAMILAFMSFFKPGDEILIPCPSYNINQQAAIAAGLRVQLVSAWLAPENGMNWQFIPKAFRTAITNRSKAILLCDPDNPTGKVLSQNEWSEIKEIVKEFNLLLLIDRTYERFPINKKPVPTPKLMDPQTIIISSISKSLRAAGLRIGWLISDPNYSEQIKHANTILFGGVASIVQIAVAHTLNKLPKIFFEKQSLYATDLAICLEKKLEQYGMPSWPVDGGLFLNVPALSVSSKTSQGAWEKMLKMGLCGVPSSAFSHDNKCLKPFVRLSFARQKTILEEAISNPYFK